MYTTAAYTSFNDPLRGTSERHRGKAHPFPVAMAFLTDGIKRLRAVGARRADAHHPLDFFRGLRNLQLESSFLDHGGTEFAPMSSSSDLRVALQYSGNAQTRLIFKIVTSSFINRGADLQYLSAFPDEVEFLYPPLTFLEPIPGQRETVLVTDGVQQVSFTVVEVVPHFSS